MEGKVFSCGDAGEDSDNDIAHFVDLVPSPQELHKKYQQFLKANGSRNNSAEWQDDGNSQDEACDLSDTACSSNGSEFSFHEIDVSDLIQKNKSYRLRNTELRTKNNQLLRSLEGYEDEVEKQRSKIQDLEKEIKSCHEVDRERANLHQELELMQMELKTAEENRFITDEEILRRKKNEEEALALVSSLRDQVDNLGNEVRCLNEVNQIKRDEAAELKNKFLRLNSELELKSFDVDQKDEEIKEIKLQLEEYVVLHKNLQEEKDKLLNELREGQLEVSTYQNFLKMSDEALPPRSPKSDNILHDLKSELAAADENSNGSFYGAGRDLRSPSSPINEVFHNYFLNRSGLNGSLNSSSVATPLAEPRSFFTRKEDNYTQTEQISLTDNECQTLEELINQEEFETLIQVQEHCTQLNEQLKWKDDEMESLNEYLDLERSQKKYFTAQLEATRRKCGQLQISLDKKTEEMLQLTDIISKLCTNKLHTWYEENCEKHKPDYFHTPSSEQATFSCSKLVDALSLENTPKLKISHKTLIPIGEHCFENVNHLYDKMSLCLESDRFSADAKIFVMNKCCDLVMKTIEKKLNRIGALLKNKCLGMEVISDEGDLTVSQLPVEHVLVLKGLVTRLYAMLKNVSFLRGNLPYVMAFKVFTHHTAQLKQTIRELESSLSSQRELKIPPALSQSTLCDESFDTSLCEEPLVEEFDFFEILMLSLLKWQWCEVSSVQLLVALVGLPTVKWSLGISVCGTAYINNGVCSHFCQIMCHNRKFPGSAF